MKYEMLTRKIRVGRPRDKENETITGMIVQLFLSRRTLFDHLPVIVSFSLSLGRPTLIFLVSISYFTLHTLLPLCLSHLLWHPQPSKTLVDLVVANPSGPGIAPAS